MHYCKEKAIQTMVKRNQEIGLIGENQAVIYLEKLGYRIIQRNYRFSHGEIDVIAVKENILVFVEVKTRRNDNYGDIKFAIDPKKQKQIRKIAESFIFEFADTLTFEEIRFDSIFVMYENNRHQIEHLENAF